MKSEVHVICCNDAIMHAVVGDKESAEAKLKEMQRTYYDTNKYTLGDEEEYRALCYWHIHTLVGDNLTVIDQL